MSRTGGRRDDVVTARSRCAVELHGAGICTRSATKDPIGRTEAPEPVGVLRPRIVRNVPLGVRRRETSCDTMSRR